MAWSSFDTGSAVSRSCPGGIGRRPFQAAKIFWKLRAAILCRCVSSRDTNVAAWFAVPPAISLIHPRERRIARKIGNGIARMSHRRPRATLVGTRKPLLLSNSSVYIFGSDGMFFVFQLQVQGGPGT